MLNVVGNYPLLHYNRSDLLPLRPVPVNSESIAELLAPGCGGENLIFRSAVWDDPSRLSPAPHGSIAATILRNLAFANDDHRIDTLLFRDAEKRLGGIPSFVEAELSNFFMALEKSSAS
jgi:hypothetical protein